MSSTTKQSAFSERQVSLAIVLVLVAVGIVAAATTWWRSTSVDPTRVFWGAVANSMTTPGVTVSESATSSGATTAQVNQFDFGPEERAQTITTFTEGPAEVRTLELSTPTADFTKYLAISVGSADKIPSSELKPVLNVWGNTTSTTKSKDTNVPSTFGTVLLELALPFGNFSPTQEAALMNQAQTQQVYTPAISSVQKKTVHGRLQYTYSVTMQPILYVQLMKTYAQDSGLHELDSVNPNEYASASATTMQWVVDARSRQVMQVSYDGHTESYSGYGLRISTATPTAKQVITGAALQSRVNTLNAAIK
ncbi:MAG TPA: hypothetical protein VIM53_01050 [Candidatus Saccharimonadales bacterium]